jgi:transmembrane sensor
MEKNYSNKHFVNWFNDDLSAEELAEFKKSPKFPLYQKIAQTSSELYAPGLDEDKILSKIKNNISNETVETTKIRPLYSRILYGAVASVAILIGIFFFVNRSSNYSTTYGEQMVVILPDLSEVTLNANSNFSFKKHNWDTNRNIELNGEAYFKVEKGSKFMVNSSLGTVEVLGTQFNINNKASIFEVMCYEGKVKVKTSINERILTEGQAFRQLIDTTTEDYIITQKKLSWTTGETTFTNAPLGQVLQAIEDQYDIKFDASQINSDQKITGSFTHSNLQIALQTVFVSLKIKSELIDNKNVLLEKE